MVHPKYLNEKNYGNSLLDNILVGYIMRIFPGEWWENKGERQERLWKKKNAAVATIKQKSVQKRNTKT